MTTSKREETPSLFSAQPLIAAGSGSGARAGGRLLGGSGFAGQGLADGRGVPAAAALRRGNTVGVELVSDPLEGPALCSKARHLLHDVGRQSPWAPETDPRSLLRS